jgi:glycosyltransferase involved in cell wall biosynthesis
MRVLVALSRFPWPLEKGDKLRAWHQLQGLATRHEVHLICLNDAPVSAQDLEQLHFCASVEVIVQRKWQIAWNLLRGAFNRIPFQVNYFRSKAMQRCIAATMQRHEIEVVFVQLIRLGENLPFDNDRRWVLDYMDAFSIGMTHRIAETNVLMRPLVKAEAARLRAYETRIAAQFDAHVIISDRDAQGLAPMLREIVHVIPNGVSESFFAELPKPDHQDFDLIFFGNMGYHPNVQSAKFLVEEVLPILHKRGIRPRLCLAGARPAPAIKAWESNEITVTGFVADIRDYVLRSKISVAPLVGGQGLQNKLLESMAMTMPTITTPVGSNGLTVAKEDQSQASESGPCVLVCDGAEAFADGIVSLLQDPAMAAHLAKDGRKFVEAHFRWSAMNAKLDLVLTGRSS